MKLQFKKCVAQLLIASTVWSALPLRSAQAGIIPTEQVQRAGEAATPSSRAYVDAMLARADVLEALQRNGVDPDAARARVAALSEDELDELAAHLDELPAGGGIVGLIFLTFIILLVTDILGYTKVFPFTRTTK